MACDVADAIPDCPRCRNGPNRLDVGQCSLCGGHFVRDRGDDEDPWYDRDANDYDDER